MTLSPEDEHLVTELAKDGRASIAFLAHALGLSTQTVQRRLVRLLEVGAIHIRTEINPKLLGLDVEVLVWVKVPPLEIDSVGVGPWPPTRQCASPRPRPEPAQLLTDCLFSDENTLYEFLTSYLGTHGATEIANAAVVVAALRRGPLILTNSWTSTPD